MTAPDRPTFVLTLRALPPLADEPPVVIRLRAALKVLLRRFRLQCLKVEEMAADGSQTPCSEGTP